jgi:hypothetical protein
MISPIDKTDRLQLNVAEQLVNARATTAGSERIVATEKVEKKRKKIVRSRRSLNY